MPIKTCWEDWVVWSLYRKKALNMRIKRVQAGFCLHDVLLIARKQDHPALTRVILTMYSYMSMQTASPNKAARILGVIENSEKAEQWQLAVRNSYKNYLIGILGEQD